MPPRTGVAVPGQGTVLLMGAHAHDAATVTAKLVSLFPTASARGLATAVARAPAHQAVIVVFDAATGTPVALMDGDAITAARTAAGSRLATRLLARSDAEVLAVVGTGVQGDAHVRALRRERDWAEIRIGARRPEAVSALAERLGAVAAESIEAAVRGADVVCVATSATEPVLRREWLAPGAHVNSVGYTTQGRELDEATVRDALVVVESRESALAPPPAGSGDLDGAQVHAELGELVAGTRPGRSRPDELTLYKSVGVALEDDAAAGLALRGAEERELGTVVEL
jgi:ornithine cyclodeaminase